MEFEKELQRFGLTEDKYEECLQTIANKKINATVDLDWSEIREKYQLILSKDTLRKANDTIFGGAFIYEYLKRKKSKESINEDTEIKDISYNNETSINKDGTYSSNRLVKMSDKESKNPTFILEAHGFDEKSWELVSAKNNIWNAYSKQDGIKTLYSSKITVKPLMGISKAEIKDFYESMVKNFPSPYVEKYYRNADNSGEMLEIPIFDLHFGKLAHSEDVSEPYNYELAKSKFNFVIDDVIKSVENRSIEKIIFPVGQDFFHVDNAQGNTTAGTAQDTDLSPKLIFKYGVECLINGIKKLSKIAPVEVFCVSGNHDWLTSYHATYSLWAYFHNNENVHVNTDTSPRKYIEYGNCLIGFTHGDKEKNRIDGIMQVESKEAWGRTLYREWHMGHLHSEHTRETNGIIIRNLSSVTGTDAWHHNSGYVGAIRKCQSFIWDKKYGLKNILITVVE